MKKEVKKIIDSMFDDFAYDDYSFVNNNGSVVQERLACKKCSTLVSDRKQALEHLIEEHNFNI